jgi:hypothetical protein
LSLHRPSEARVEQECRRGVVQPGRHEDAERGRQGFAEMGSKQQRKQLRLVSYFQDRHDAGRGEKRVAPSGPARRLSSWRHIPSPWPRPKTPCQRSRKASGYPPADRAMPRKGKSVNASPRQRGRPVGCWADAAQRPSPPVTRDGSLDRGQKKPAIFNHGGARVPKRRGGGNGQPINRRR